MTWRDCTPTFVNKRTEATSGNAPHSRTKSRPHQSPKIRPFFTTRHFPPGTQHSHTARTSHSLHNNIPLRKPPQQRKSEANTTALTKGISPYLASIKKKTSLHPVSCLRLHFDPFLHRHIPRLADKPRASCWSTRETKRETLRLRGRRHGTRAHSLLVAVLSPAVPSAEGPRSVLVALCMEAGGLSLQWDCVGRWDVVDSVMGV